MSIAGIVGAWMVAGCSSKLPTTTLDVGGHAVKAEVASTYVDIRTFERRLEIARDNVAIQQRSLEIAQARFEGGVVRQVDGAVLVAVAGQGRATSRDGPESAQQGPTADVAVGCECFDLDDNGRVDLKDFAALTQSFTG